MAPPVVSEMGTEVETTPPFLYFKLDENEFSEEQIAEISTALGGRSGKYVLVGTNTETTETHNEAFLVFIPLPPSDAETTHEEAWETVHRERPHLELKDAGYYDPKPGKERFYHISTSLSDKIDANKSIKWRMWLAKNSGIKVSNPYEYLD